ncbi:MAG: winged helix-turn-helix transcriptional regulator [Candidatus Nanohaloarchaea archaeon]
MTLNEKIIVRTVKDNPGIGFSELKEKTGLSNGVIQHYVQSSEELEKKKGAILEKDLCKECPIQADCGDKCALRVLRKPVKRKIYNLKTRDKTQLEISEKLDISQSTVSYHIKDLRNCGLID